MEAFATFDDLAARWRALPQDQDYIASTLLDDASQMVRDRFGDVDTRIADGSLSSNSVLRIVCAMVKRAMLNADGVSQQQQAAGPFSMGQTYSNPSGNLYFNADEIALLEGTLGQPKARMGWLL